MKIIYNLVLLHLLTIPAFANNSTTELNESKLNHLNDENFVKLTSNATLPILVEFTADWCGPCKMVRPFILEVAEDAENNFFTVVVDIDESPKTAKSFGVRSIPTRILFSRSERLGISVGASPKSGIINWINRVLEK